MCHAMPFFRLLFDIGSGVCCHTFSHNVTAPGRTSAYLLLDIRTSKDKSLLVRQGFY